MEKYIRTDSNLNYSNYSNINNSVNFNDTKKEAYKIYNLCHLSNTRLLGRFAPIFYFQGKHVLFVYIVKKIAVFKKKFRGFSKFSKIEF